MKPRQALHQLSVTIPSSWEDAAGALLEEAFGQSPAVFCRPESETSELSLFLDAARPPSRGDLVTLRQRLSALPKLGFPQGSPRIRRVRLKGRDWQESWKHHFKAFEVGRHLLLKPSWSRRKAKPGQSVVILDPGLSFGTGQHPTTRFCLRELARARRPRPAPSFLDIGTGSGILAIAAVKLGYAPVQAFDFDESAVRVAQTNARRNRVGHKLPIQHADLTQQAERSRSRWDLVCANLLADLLVSQASKILNRVKPGGALVLAGILTREFKDVDAVFRGLGAQRLRKRVECEWCSASYRVDR
jgi:ribosomal protein L11 methyltransferase